MESRFEVWQKALTDLIDAYRDVERRALDLPVIVLGRSVRRGRPRTGEAGSFPYELAPRILVAYLLAEHFAGRLQLARRSLLVDASLTAEEQDGLTRQIDRALQIWPRRPVVSLLVRYVLPFGGLLAGIATLGRALLAALWRQPSGVPPSWLAVATGYVLLACLVPGFAWIVKRELMQGATGTSVGAVNRLGGAGVYGVESRVFGPLAPVRREPPLDLIILFVVLTLLVAWMLFVETTSFPMLRGPVVVFALALEAGTVFGTVAAFVQRRRRGRW